MNMSITTYRFERSIHIVGVEPLGVEPLGGNCRNKPFMDIHLSSKDAKFIVAQLVFNSDMPKFDVAKHYSRCCEDNVRFNVR